MAAVDKNQAVIDFLLTCPYVAANPLFFNFIHEKDNNKQFITTGNDRAINRPYIDGTVLKQYTFTIIDFKSVAFNAIVNVTGGTDENVSNMAEVQGLLDWINEQADAHTYPNFGTDCEIEDMIVLTENPNLNGIDSGTNPVLAKYSASIQITYLDKSKAMWNVE